MKATSRIFRFAAALALISVIAGCPAVPPVSVDDPVVDDGGNSTPTTGSFKIKGNIFDNEAIKSLSAEQMQRIGNALKHQSAWITVYLPPVGDPTEENTQYFHAYINQDGSYEAEFAGIKPVDYYVASYISDEYWYTMFMGPVDNRVISIEAGKVQKVNLVMDFCPSYGFNFSMPIPNLADWGNAQVVTADASFWCSWWTNEFGQKVFQTELPLDFEGGSMILRDLAGNTICADLPLVPASLDWETYRFWDVLPFDFNLSRDFGGIDVNILFSYEMYG